MNFFLDLLHLLSMFGLDMLPYKFRPFELFARERTQPFVLAELLSVCGDEFLHLLLLVLQPELPSLLVSEFTSEDQEAAHLLLECGHVLLVNKS